MSSSSDASKFKAGLATKEDIILLRGELQEIRKLLTDKNSEDTSLVETLKKMHNDMLTKQDLDHIKSVLREHLHLKL